MSPLTLSHLPHLFSPSSLSHVTRLFLFLSLENDLNSCRSCGRALLFNFSVGSSALYYTCSGGSSCFDFEGDSQFILMLARVPAWIRPWYHLWSKAEQGKQHCIYWFYAVTYTVKAVKSVVVAVIYGAHFPTGDCLNSSMDCCTRWFFIIQLNIYTCTIIIYT